MVKSPLQELKFPTIWSLELLTIQMSIDIDLNTLYEILQWIFFVYRILWFSNIDFLTVPTCL